MKEKNECIITDYPGLISLDCIKKIPEQMEQKICKVTVGQNKGTGFFTKIPFPDKNNMLPVFMTNNHVINRGLLYKKDSKIQLDIKAENQIKEINLNNRMKYTRDEKQYAITIIEIKEEDNIKHFLELDDIIINGLINNENKNKEFIDETIYIIQYPKCKLALSFGILKDIDLIENYNFSHKCSTEDGSSGAPILNMNNKVIGIHKRGNNNIENNYGTFLNHPIKKLYSLNNNGYIRKIIKKEDKPNILFKKPIIYSSKRGNKIQNNDKDKEKFNDLVRTKNIKNNRLSFGTPKISFEFIDFFEFKNNRVVHSKSNENFYENSSEMSIKYRHINNDNFNSEYINTINHKNTYSGISKVNQKRSKNNLQFSSKKLDTNSFNTINFNIKNNNMNDFLLKKNLSRDKLEQESKKRIRNYIMSDK